MSDTASLKQAEQQMLMVRPWHAAADSSIWEISGDYRNNAGTFTDCLAMALPHFATGGHVLFKFLGALSTGDGYDVVSPDQITHATPLLLVHRDEPGTAYWADDQTYIGGSR